MNLQSETNQNIIDYCNERMRQGVQIPVSYSIECKHRFESLHNDFIKLKEHLTEQYHIANSKYKNAKSVHDKKYYFGRLQIARNAIDMIETFNFVNSNCT